MKKAIIVGGIAVLAVAAAVGVAAYHHTTPDTPTKKRTRLHTLADDDTASGTAETMSGKLDSDPASKTSTRRHGDEQG